MSAEKRCKVCRSTEQVTETLLEPVPLWEDPATPKQNRHVAFILQSLWKMQNIRGLRSGLQDNPLMKKPHHTHKVSPTFSPL